MIDAVPRSFFHLSFPFSASFSFSGSLSKSLASCLILFIGYFMVTHVMNLVLCLDSTNIAPMASALYLKLLRNLNPQVRNPQRPKPSTLNPLILTPRYPGSWVVPFCPFCFRVPLLKLSIRTKGTLIVKGRLRDLNTVP